VSAARLLTIAQMLIRVCFLAVLVLGALFWTGHADSLRGVHILAGILIVLALWAIATIALLRDVNRAVAGAAYIWGIVTVVFGLNQETIVPGTMHWVTQVAHLLVGVVAVALAELLGARLRRYRAA
jgi:hypothetical protein